MGNDNASAHAAIDYDANIERSIPYHAAFHAEIMRFVAVARPNPARWLDTGCGTGSLVARARAQFLSTHFHVVDPSAAMLEQARAKLAEVDRVTVLPPAGSAALATVLDAGAAFDVITAVQCHHYLDRNGRREALIACRERLVPGGVLLTFENVRPAKESDLVLAKRYWAAYQVEMGKSPVEAQSHVDRLGREFFPIPIDEHLALLRDLGFASVGLLWFSYLQAGFYAIR